MVRYLTITQAAKEAGAARATVVVWIKRGKIETIEANGKTLVNREELLAYCKNRISKIDKQIEILQKAKARALEIEEVDGGIEL